MGSNCPTKTKEQLRGETSSMIATDYTTVRTEPACLHQGEFTRLSVRCRLVFLSPACHDKSLVDPRALARLRVRSRFEVREEREQIVDECRRHVCEPRHGELSKRAEFVREIKRLPVRFDQSKESSRI